MSVQRLGATKIHFCISSSINVTRMVVTVRFLLFEKSNTKNQNTKSFHNQKWGKW